MVDLIPIRSIASTCMLAVPSSGNDRYCPILLARYATSQSGCGKRDHFLLSADIHRGTDRQSHIDRISTGSRCHTCPCGTCHDLNQVGCNFIGAGGTDVCTDLVGVRSRWNCHITASVQVIPGVGSEADGF